VHMWRLFLYRESVSLEAPNYCTYVEAVLIQESVSLEAPNYCAYVEAVLIQVESLTRGSKLLCICGGCSYTG